MRYQSLGFVSPTPVRYENFYLEGKCRGKTKSENVEKKRATIININFTE